MSILMDENTRVIVQGITGRDGAFHTKQMLEYGTKIVGGTTPGKGGEKVHGVPVFNTVEQAVKMTGANASVLFVPAKFATDAIYESAGNGIKLIIAISEGIPTMDIAKILPYLKTCNCKMIGPNCPGIIVPGIGKIGIFPTQIFQKGNVGIVSRSGTLTYEIVYNLTINGLGQSACIGMGGDSIIGMKFKDYLELFEQDDETDAVVMIGEIGGTDEQDAAEYIKKHFSKPVVAFIAGKSAPPGKRMGHAGAIISGGDATAETKIKVLKHAGVTVINEPEEIGKAVRKILAI